MLTKNKQLLYSRQARLISALSDQTRLAIIDFLKDGEQCVCDIAKYIGAERSNISKHLSVMVSAGLLESRKEGLNVIYSIKTPCILDFIDCTANCFKEQAKETQKLLKEI